MQRGNGQAKPQPRSLDKLPTPSSPVCCLLWRQQASAQVSGAWGRTQTLEVEKGVEPHPVHPSPWLETRPEKRVQGQGFSVLPSLLVREALATV